MRPSSYEIPILPEQLYSVGQAARYFGVHRCTIYDYLHHPTRPLPYLRSPRNGRTIFLGQTLIEYKQMGLDGNGYKSVSVPEIVWKVE